MDLLPEIKPLNETQQDIKEEFIDKTSVDEDMHQDNSLEIEVPDEVEDIEESKIFEKTPEKPPKRGRGRPKRVDVKIEPPEQDEEVELEVEDNIEEIEIPKMKAKQARSYRDIAWLNEVFSAGADKNWLSSKRIKVLLEKYGKEHGTLTYARFCKWAKFRFGSMPKKNGIASGLNRINIATQEDLMYVLSIEGEEFAVPKQKEQKTFDFSDFKSYMDEYEREKESKRKQEEIDRLKKEKEELELEQRYFAKFQRQQIMQRQKATSSLPPQQTHIDWSQYRGI